MKKIISIVCAGVLAVGVFAGCGSNNSSKESYESGKLSEVLTAVKDAYGDMYYPDMSYEAEQIEGVYGIKSDIYEEAFAEVPRVNINIDSFIGVEAKEGKVDEVRNALEAYRDNEINNTMQYPANLIKIKGSKVYTRGNYVFFICLAQIPQDVEENGDEEAQIKAVEEGNDIAIEAINSVLK